MSELPKLDCYPSESIKHIYGAFDTKYPVPDNADDQEVGSVRVGNHTNVVSGKKLREIQNRTLKETAQFISKTFGPMGSNTKIISGENAANLSSTYSKDGLKVLSKIINSGPIEASIVEELIEITHHVEKEVGDGTTSTVILSSLIFDRLSRIEGYPPYALIRVFKSVVEKIKEYILADAKECTLDDIYDIAMISTNGNEQVSGDIRKIYEDFGFNVDLNVGISNNADTVRKVYDGLTITEGFSDPCFINNRGNDTAEIHNAHVFHFADPIDDMYMISLFEAIIEHNIYERYKNEEEFIPTVITCPKISSDMSSTLKRLSEMMYQFDHANSANNKPPVLIITNVIASDELIMDDIATLCGCKTIHKYIDKEVYQKDVEAGVAPTVETVWDFAGKAELVVADNKKTKFINPEHMKKEDGSEDPIYTSMVNYLSTEIEQSADKNAVEVGLLKKRLSALQSNMVDYLVGGITISDRDAVKDLAEDAIKNCRSAVKYGIGYAANYEGLRWSLETVSYYAQEDVSSLESRIAQCIFSSYFDITKVLYGTVSTNDELIDEAITESINNGHPFNIKSGSLDTAPEDDTSVKCSIMLDINILDTIAKIITRMVTCNQCLLQASHLNTYE